MSSEDLPGLIASVSDLNIGKSKREDSLLISGSGAPGALRGFSKAVRRSSLELEARNGVMVMELLLRWCAAMDTLGDTSKWLSMSARTLRGGASTESCGF